MTFLCLFVVLTALFITVFNSRTANPLQVRKNMMKELTNSSTTNPVTTTE